MKRTYIFGLPDHWNKHIIYYDSAKDEKIAHQIYCLHFPIHRMTPSFIESYHRELIPTYRHRSPHPIEQSSHMSHKPIDSHSTMDCAVAALEILRIQSLHLFLLQWISLEVLVLLLRQKTNPSDPSCGRLTCFLILG